MGIEGASLYAAVGVDIGRAVNNLTAVGSAFDRVVASAEAAERQANDFGVEAQEWAQDFGKVAQEAADASVMIDRLARRREMPLADADRLRQTLDRLGAEADQAGAEMAELARQGKSIDPQRSAELAKQINRVESELREATAQADKFDRELDSAHRNTGLFNGALTKMGPLLGALGFAGVTYGIVNMVRSMVGGASEMEKFRVQFEVLLGSASAAKARIDELAEFGKTTPFELPEVVRASRTLEVFTKGALSAGEGLRLVGDVAAGTGMPFEDVAMWVGRMYDALQSGRPFGEATMRLQEMGAIGGEARSRIEELAAGVKSGAMTIDQAWEGVAGEFGRFSGMMERQSQTLEGQWSNLMDTIGMGLTRWGEQLMPLINRLVPALIDGLGGILDAGLPVMTFIGERLVGVFENLDSILITLATFSILKFISGLSAIELRAKAAALAMRALTGAAVLFLPEIMGAVGGVQDWVYQMTRGEKAAKEFQATMKALGGDRMAATFFEKLVEPAGIGLERWVQAVEAAGGDLNQAWSDIEHGVDPVAETWARNMDEGTRAAAAFARQTADILEHDLGDEVDRTLTDIDDRFGAFVQSVEETPKGVAATLQDGTVLVGESAEELAGLVQQAFLAAKEASIQAMKDMMGGIADVMSEDEIVKLVEDNADKIADEWSDLGRRGFIEATLASKQISDGLRSKDTDVVQDTIKLVDALLGQYDAMAPGALARGELVNPALLEGIMSNLGLTETELQEMAEALGLTLDFSDAAEGYGADNIAAFADGVSSMEEEAKRVTGIVASRAINELDDTGSAMSWGYNLIHSYAQGMRNAMFWITDAAVEAASIPRNIIGVNSEPRDANSPLHGITQWGGNLVKTFAGGIYDNLNELYAAASAMAGAFGPMGAPGLAFAGATPSADASTLGAGGVGQLHLHTELTVMGDLKNDTKEDVEETLIRSSRFAAAEIVNF